MNGRTWFRAQGMSCASRRFPLQLALNWHRLHDIDSWMRRSFMYGYYTQILGDFQKFENRREMRHEITRLNKI